MDDGWRGGRWGVTLMVRVRRVRRAVQWAGRGAGRVVEQVRLGRLAARADEQLHAHRLSDVRALVRRHAAHQVRLREESVLLSHTTL